MINRNRLLEYDYIHQTIITPNIRLSLADKILLHRGPILVGGGWTTFVSTKDFDETDTGSNNFLPTGNCNGQGPRYDAPLLFYILFWFF